MIFMDGFDVCGVGKHDSIARRWAPAVIASWTK
jgi:hypothetical protein